MRNRLPFLSQKLFNTPLAVHPGRLEVIVAALAERIGVASFTRLSGDTVALKPSGLYLDDENEFTGPGRNDDMGYDVMSGVAIIPVHGTLVQKLGTVRPHSGLQGYDVIRAAFLCAVEDPGVEAIVLDCDSPGGEVSGAFDLADEIFRARGVKPLLAICDEIAYSAAYAIASAADRITVPRTGGIGSVGVLCAHVDLSKALSGAGINITLIQYGERKTDGAPEKPLEKEALARFQADIDMMGELFVNTVARNRGMSPDAVRDTQAMTYLGAAGVAVGFADAVMAPDAAFRELLSTLA